MIYIIYIKYNHITPSLSSLSSDQKKNWKTEIRGQGSSTYLSCALPHLLDCSFHASDKVFPGHKG